MKASSPFINIAYCAATAKATYSASQQLSATQACFLEAQDTTLLSLFTLEQKPEIGFLASA